MSFAAPVWLFAILPLLIWLAWWYGRSYAQLANWARRSALGLRLVVGVCLIGALAEPVWERESDRPHLVFVIDVSRSVSPGNVEAALDDVEKLVKQARQEDRQTSVSVVAFGERAELLVADDADWSTWSDKDRRRLLHRRTESELQAKRVQLIGDGQDDNDAERRELEKQFEELEAFTKEKVGQRTDVDAAMRLALSVGSSSGGRSIFLFTDGQFHSDHWQAGWNRARRESASVNLVRYDLPSDPEVTVATITVPPSVRIHEGFSARVNISATVSTSSELVIYKDGFLVDRRTVNLSPGEQTFETPPLSFEDKGFHTIEATIRAANDTLLENNRGRATVSVPGPVRVLYVDGDEGQLFYLKQALEVEGMQVDARGSTGVPTELAELLGFDAFVLSNVPSDKLSLAQMRMIKSYVEDFGGGFVMLGGDESFGLGGYFDTPIEEILPVQMPIKKDLNRPSLALVMVIDKSGSMEGAKIQLAKRAAIATTDVVNPRDLVGLIGFDSASRIILELTPAADRGTIQSHIASLDAGGGTFLRPAMEMAHDRLLAANARRKHVIILSDGQTEGAGYEDLASTMGADGISVSTIGIGEGADMQLLEGIAQSGGGRSYFTNEFFRIPQIFTREALRASKSMLVEELVQPKMISDDVALREIDPDDLPLLLGYVATSQRPAANTIIVSHRGDPLLAKWRYGLGQTVAFTSETKPRWAEDWLDWSEFAKFWSQLIRSITIQGRGQTVAVETTHRATPTGAVLTAELQTTSGDFVDSATVTAFQIDARGQSQELSVRHVGPGLFEANLADAEYGTPRQIIWKVQVGDDPLQPHAQGFVESFSPEFATLGVNEAVFDEITLRRQGVTMSVGRTRLHLGDSSRRQRISLWPWLLIAGLCLVPIDILVRRVG